MTPDPPAALLCIEPDAVCEELLLRVLPQSILPLVLVCVFIAWVSWMRSVRVRPGSGDCHRLIAQAGVNLRYA